MDPIRTLGGHEVRLLPQVLEALKATLRGDIITRTSPEYEHARALWNGRIDRQPALIARCADTGDVQRIVRFAANHNLLTAVRGGGQSLPGYSTCDGGLVIDLTRMRRAHVNVMTRTVIAEGGCTVADIDRVTQPHGLATPLGIYSATGVGGLALGGGVGWLSRKFGMTIDNLFSAEIVTANGELLHVSEAEHDDLFWAIRGGGGNFGVVTRFELALHRIGPQILAGLIVFPAAELTSALRLYRDVAASAPDELSLWAMLRQAPPLYFLPAEYHQRAVVIIAACYCGADLDQGERLLAPLRTHPHVITEKLSYMPFANWQQAFDPLASAGAHNYWRSHDLTQLPDALLRQLEAQLAALPSAESEIVIAHVGGTMGRVPPNRTAYPNRATRYIMSARARWQDPIAEDNCVQWARNTFRNTMPFATGSVYINHLAGDEPTRIGHAYGLNFARLIDVKNRYDPSNFFRVNHNVRPAPANVVQARV